MSSPADARLATAYSAVCRRAVFSSRSEACRWSCNSSAVAMRAVLEDIAQFLGSLGCEVVVEREAAGA